jgi:hypothetical protein
MEAGAMLRAVGRFRSARGIFATTRFWVYVSCAALAVLTSYLLGKEMMWDNLDYHFYAGFSALHDRFVRDYFAAGVQSYLNPYVYAPFYALARTGLPALWAASVLAVVQSGILWLTYELAIAVSPPDDSRARFAAGVCAALLALANPILIAQLGSSFADITTAELVLAAWLLLVHALRTPVASRVIWAGLLLGAASGLKLTNLLHALSACVLLLFLPIPWRRKAGLSLGFIATMAVGFAAIMAPWAMHLEQHFGNPFFPLFNNIFRSPQFPAVPMADHRFVPGSLVEALWRPFQTALPITFVDDEYSSPDPRYALLLMLALAAFALWGWRRFRRPPNSGVATAAGSGSHALVGLACAFLVDWVLWLRVSGNGRYFLAMACVAGVLGMVLAFRILAGRPRALLSLLVAVFVVQAVQLAYGTKYRISVPWDGGSWFEVSVPSALTGSAALYFMIGEESESFVAPYLGDRSAFVNLDGDYVLGPRGANGARIRSLIQQYAGHIRVAVMASEYERSSPKSLSDVAHADDTLAPFGLRVDAGACSTVTVRNLRLPWRTVLPGTLPINLPQLNAGVLRVPISPDGYLVTCRVVPDPDAPLTLTAAEREPDLVFDRLESECPQLFQPPNPVTEVYGDARKGYLWMRKYPGTNVTAVLSEGYLRLVDGARGGRPVGLGAESGWAKGPMPLACGGRGKLY